VPAPKPTVDTPAEAPEPKAETAGAVDLTPATPDVVTTAAAVALPLAESVQTALEPVLR
jgi:hypothetical protein